jgi:hypothetical protein
MRLFRRRPLDAVEMWRAELDQAHAAEPPRWTGGAAHVRTPDLDPSEVPPPKRIGMTGGPLPEYEGGITGLPSGGHTPPPYDRYGRG